MEGLKIMEKRYVNAEEMAEILGYTVDHLRKLTRANTIPALKFGRRWKYDVAAVQRAIVSDSFKNEYEPKNQRKEPTVDDILSSLGL